MTRSTDVTLPSDRAAAAVGRAASQATAVEQARAVAEVAAAVQVAQQFPRDVDRALERMRRACQQPALADRAFYSVPRSGSRVEGTTVHVARELAACWGNVDYGIRELRRDDVAGESELQAWAWDQETNVRSVRSFVVPHARMAGSGAAKRREALTDLADIANNNNSVAARAVRETIFTVLPVWFRTEAETILATTLKGETAGKSQAQLVDEAVQHYARTWNVTREQLEARLGRAAGEWTEQDLAVLRVLNSELARSEKRVADEFPAAGPQRVTAAEVEGQQPRGRGRTRPAPSPDDVDAQWNLDAAAAGGEA